MDSPVPGALVASPLRIQGYARGNWFFEGDFPVVLKDTKDKTIVKRFATAKNGWMTETFVPFESMIEFKRPGSGSKGTLVLKKNNPTDRWNLTINWKYQFFLNDIACITIKKKSHLIIDLFWDLTI